MGNTVGYTRTYRYDRLGNMLKLHHSSNGNNWSRYFDDYDNNPTDAFAVKNTASMINSGGSTTNYTFDDCGNMLTEGSSRHFEWSYGDVLRAYRTQSGTSEPSVFTHYLYDAGGVRLKKITRNISGDPTVSVYIDGAFDHSYKVSATTGTRSYEHNEIHVMDDRIRIANLRIGTPFPGDNAPAVRYYLEDHLGNCSFTLESNGSIFSREEYFPFGETSYGSFAKKRYRFCGKERDEESGLYYYGARYYAAWTCRFVSVDPLAGDYPFYTPYQYAGNQPIIAIDLDGLEPLGGQSVQAFDESITIEAEKNPELTKIEEKLFGQILQKSAWNLSDITSVWGFFKKNHEQRAKAKNDQPADFKGICTYDCFQALLVATRMLYNDYDLKQNSNNVQGFLKELYELGYAGEEITCQFGYSGIDENGNTVILPHRGNYYPDKWYSPIAEAMINESEGKVGIHLFGVALFDSHHAILVTLINDDRGGHTFFYQDQNVGNGTGVSGKGYNAAEWNKKVMSWAQEWSTGYSDPDKFYYFDAPKNKDFYLGINWRRKMLANNCEIPTDKAKTNTYFRMFIKPNNND